MSPFWGIIILMLIIWVPIALINARSEGKHPGRGGRHWKSF